MSYYRLYVWGARGIVGFEDIDAKDDRSAIAQVEARGDILRTELWCGGRLVQSSNEAQRRTG